MPIPRWNFSLKQFLLACGLISIAMGLIAIASLRAVGELAFPGAALLGLGIGILARRPRLVCGVFVLIAIASWFTPRLHWIGGTDPYVLQMTIIDSQGNPIEGATVTPRLDGEPIAERFFADASAPMPTSDATGRLTRVALPHRFGGQEWFLFWCISIPNHPPSFVYSVVVDVEHPSFETVRFSAAQLLDAVEALENPAIRTDVQFFPAAEDVPILPQKVTMESK